MKFLKTIALSSFAFFTTIDAALADGHAPAILTVLEAPNGSAVAEFSLEDLQELDMSTFSTTTIWTDGIQEFSGVSLAALISHLDVTEGTIFASAINDYTVEIPVADAVEDGPIVAYFLNGQPMSVRDKGPLWVVYPYDAKSEYRAEVIYSRSIWQLDRITISR